MDSRQVNNSLFILAIKSVNAFSPRWYMLMTKLKLEEWVMVFLLWFPVLKLFFFVVQKPLHPYHFNESLCIKDILFYNGAPSHYFMILLCSVGVCVCRLCGGSEMKWMGDSLKMLATPDSYDIFVPLEPKPLFSDHLAWVWATCYVPI